MKKLVSTGYCIILIGLLITEPVYAYLDPGTGSLIIQGLIASTIAIGAFVKIKWAKIKEYFAKRK